MSDYSIPCSGENPCPSPKICCYEQGTEGDMGYCSESCDQELNSRAAPVWVTPAIVVVTAGLMIYMCSKMER